MWTTLLIGGQSRVGKSTLAWQLAHVETAEVWSLDELAATDQPESEWLLERAETWDQPPEEVVQVLRRAGSDFAPALEAMVYRSENLGARRVIIEGERVRPDVVAALAQRVGPTLAAVFVVELDEAKIRESLQRHSRNFRLLSAARQDTVVRVNGLYGRWLEREARALNLQVIAPHPWTTLFVRAGRAAARPPVRPNPSAMPGAAASA